MCKDLLACYRDLKKGSSQTEQEGMRPDSGSQRAFDGLILGPLMLSFCHFIFIFHFVLRTCCYVSILWFKEFHTMNSLIDLVIFFFLNKLNL